MVKIKLIKGHGSIRKSKKGNFTEDEKRYDDAINELILLRISEKLLKIRQENRTIGYKNFYNWNNSAMSRNGKINR